MLWTPLAAALVGVWSTQAPLAHTLHCTYKRILQRAVYAFASLACWTIYIGRATGVFFALAFLMLTDRVTVELIFDFEVAFPIKLLLDRSYVYNWICRVAPSQRFIVMLQKHSNECSKS